MLFAENNGKSIGETKVVTRFFMKFWTSGLWTRPIRVPHRSSIMYLQLRLSLIQWKLCEAFYNPLTLLLTLIFSCKSEICAEIKSKITRTQEVYLIKQQEV